MSFNIKKIVAVVAVVAALAGVGTVATTHSVSAARITSQTTGYIKDGSRFNGGYRWYDHGKLYTGFRFYMGTYYWFINGVRQNQGWRTAWGMTYYTDNTGRAVQGTYKVGSTVYDFGNNGTFFSRGVVKDAYVNVPGVGWRWVQNGKMFTGFKYYMGTYYWFNNGIRQNSGWHTAWGNKYYTDSQGRAVQGWQNINGKNYYFGNNGTFFLRNAPSTTRRNDGGDRWNGAQPGEVGGFDTGARVNGGTLADDWAVWG